MLWKYVATLDVRGKDAVKAIKAKLIAILHYILTFAISVRATTISMLIVPTSVRKTLNREKRYRLTSDHSPVFSLFTFFPDRY